MKPIKAYFETGNLRKLNLNLYANNIGPNGAESLASGIATQ